MKEYLLALGFFALLIHCYGQGNEFRIGSGITYSSIRLAASNPHPSAYYSRFFHVISPSVRLAYKKHQVYVSYDLISPYINGVFGGIREDKPKGVSGNYSYELFRFRQLSVATGIDVRFFEYFTSRGVGTFDIAKSVSFNDGYLVSLVKMGPHLGIRGDWKKFTAEIRVNFDRARARTYDLGINREERIWANYLIVNWGVTYWIRG